MGKTALFLGPGGPFGGVEIGALKAFDEKGKKFDVIAGNSIGSAIALTYSSPAKRYKGDYIQALEDLKRYTSLAPPLADLTKKCMPFNYRIWHKSWGEYNTYYEEMMKYWLSDEMLEFFDSLPKLWQDIIGLWASYMTPINLQWGFTNGVEEVYKVLPDNEKNMLSYWITAISSFLPKSMSTGFIVALHEGMRKLIDFDNLKNVPYEVYIGALNLQKRQAEIFSREEITPAHLQASTTVIFMNELTRINNIPYAESTYVDAYNFKQVLEAHPDIDTIVLIDILGMKSWVYAPKDLMDAFNVSITGGFANSARDDLAIFEERYLNKTDKNGKYLFHQRKIDYIKIGYDVPEDIHPTWSYDVMDRLEKIGHDAALQYVDRF